MKKLATRFAALLLLSCLLLSLLPLASFAESPTSYNLWLGSTQVTSENKNDILGNGKAVFTPDANNPNKGVLTLHQLTADDIQGKSNDSLIYAREMDLTLRGSAELTTKAYWCVNGENAVLRISGDFILEGSDFGLRCTGASGALSFEAGRTEAYGKSSGVCAYNGANLTVRGGTVYGRGQIGIRMDATNSTYNVPLARVEGGCLIGEGSYTSLMTYVGSQNYGKAVEYDASKHVITVPANAQQLYFPLSQAWRVTDAEGNSASQVVITPRSCTGGHSFSSVEYSWTQKDTGWTCTARQACIRSNCGCVERETVTASAARAKEPTCTAPGETRYTAAFSNPAFSAQTRTEVDIPALGHHYQEPTVSWDDALGTATAARVCEHDAAHFETETAAVTAALTKRATYYEEGEITYTAIFSNPAFGTQTVTVPRLGNPFSDVKEGACYFDAVLWAVYAEPQVTAGTGPSTFSPKAVCTRAQVLTFLWKAMGQPEPTEGELPFEDVPADAYYAKAVRWAMETGLTAGTTETTFSPKASCTRGQIVIFLYAAFAE